MSKRKKNKFSITDLLSWIVICFLTLMGLALLIVMIGGALLLFNWFCSNMDLPISIRIIGSILIAILIFRWFVLSDSGKVSNKANSRETPELLRKTEQRLQKELLEDRCHLEQLTLSSLSSPRYSRHLSVGESDRLNIDLEDEMFSIRSRISNNELELERIQRKLKDSHLK